MQETYRDTPSATEDVAPTIEEIVDYALEEHHMDGGRDTSSPYETYHTQLWTLTRVVKSHFTEKADADAVFWELIEPEIERRGGWEILDVWLDVEEIYFEFVCNWDAVRYKIGETPLGNALEKAEAHPLRPRRSTRYPEFLARYSRFVSVAGWLQVAMGNRPILLPVAKLAVMLGVKPMTITRYRQTAERDGYLRVVKEHSYSKSRATEFFFDVTRFEVLRNRAQAGTEASYEAGEHMV
jgi:hypothetical protein